MTRLTVDPTRSLEPQLAAAAAAIRRGGVVAFPTDTLYGLAADPTSDTAVQRLFSLKGRAGDRKAALIAADVSQIDRVAVLTPTARQLAAQFWPGPLTLLLPARTGLARDVRNEDGLVGVRIPDHAVARALARACGTALTATSANRSGDPPTADPSALVATLPDIDVLVDGGPSPGGAPSTIVDLGNESPRLVRDGAIAWSRVLDFLDATRR